MKPIPILFLSDAPELQGGLSRITRDLATLVSTLPEFRVGVLGRGGRGSRHFPFANYSFPESAQWGEDYLEPVWDDFAGKERGIIFTIWDASRLLWFAQPKYMEGELRDFLMAGHFERWGYFPIDSTGPQGRLSCIPAETIAGFARILAYGAWGQQQIIQSTGRQDVDWIPHGLDIETFQPRDRQRGRVFLGDRVHEDDLLIGCLMTNQRRKDWGLAFEIFRGLRDKHKAIRFWGHTDLLEREWSLLALARDFGVDADTIITTSFSDQELSCCYSACDVTILPSLGEGFGFPIVESLACGVPVIHGNYGGGVELIPRASWLVDPITHRFDTPYDCARPVFQAASWITAIETVLEEKVPADECRRSVEHLDWQKLWPATFKKWFLAGLP